MVRGAGPDVGLYLGLPERLLQCRRKASRIGQAKTLLEQSKAQQGLEVGTGHLVESQLLVEDRGTSKTMLHRVDGYLQIGLADADPALGGKLVQHRITNELLDRPRLNQMHPPCPKRGAQVDLKALAFGAERARPDDQVVQVRGHVGAVDADRDAGWRGAACRQPQHDEDQREEPLSHEPVGDP
jgi:hypothetical protein